MAWTRLQLATPVQGASPQTISFPNPCTPGSIIVVGVFDSPIDVNPVLSVSDPTNGAYTMLTPASNNGSDSVVQIWIVKNTGSTALTITGDDSLTSNHFVMFASEWSGGTLNTDGTSAIAAFPSTATPTTPGINPIGLSDFLVAVIGDPNAGSINLGAGWNSEGISNGAVVALMESQANVAPGSYSATATLNTPETTYAGVLAALQEAIIANSIQAYGPDAATEDFVWLGGDD